MRETMRFIFGSILIVVLIFFLIGFVFIPFVPIFFHYIEVWVNIVGDFVCIDGYESAMCDKHLGGGRQ